MVMLGAVACDMEELVSYNSIEEGVKQQAEVVTCNDTEKVVVVGTY